MHEMQTIVTSVCAVCQSVSLSVTNAPNDPAETPDLASLCRVIWCNLCQITLASCLQFCL